MYKNYICFSDEQLLEPFKDGVIEAQKVLIERYRKKIYQFSEILI